MTPPPGAGAAAASRAPLPLLILLYALPFAVAAITPLVDLQRGPQGDISLYMEKAYLVLSGLAPYRDFPLEYPPFALVPMVVPYVLWPFGPPSVGVYAWLFAGQAAVMLLALALVLGRIVRIRATWSTDPGRSASDLPTEQRRVGFQLLILAAGASLALTWRFDLFPVLLASFALWAALERRPVVSGAAIGIGVLAKLFPLVIAPALAVVWLAPLDRARLTRFAASVVVVVMVGMLPFVALAGFNAFAFVGYQAERGLQIESVGGGLVLMWGLIRGEPVGLFSPFSAWEVTGTLGRALLALTSVALVAGFGGLALIGWRRARAEAARDGAVAPATIVTLATGAILVLVLTSKVFSIQYVVWLVPFAALLPWRKFWLAAVAVALTIPIHPVLYEALVGQEALPILVLNLRNALLGALLGWVMWDLVRPSPPEVAGQAKAEPSTAASALEGA